jgi:predicted flap endonuclease-1-like 5' DNA nuclease
MMKKQYLYIGLFGLWCLASSLWYFLSVKGVITDPQTFNPQSATIAIIEILVMLFVACLLGYAIAWYFRSETVENQIAELDSLQGENNSLAQTKAEYKNQVELWREKHRHDLSLVQQKSAELISEREKLSRHKSELEISLQESRRETSDAKLNLQQIENEIGTLRYRNRQLEFQVKESDESNSRLKAEVDRLATQKQRVSVSEHPFVRPVEPETKDDFTKIRGIGPFIEKRLNMIGIYTFQQLAELPPDMIDRVGAAIEFFPHRIIKDNWVGQANRFARA